MPKIAIIGAGISGLTLAYRLKQYLAEVQIEILESEKTVGGKISSQKDQGFIYEAGPNGFLDSNPSTFNLSKELGLTSRFIGANESSSKNRFLFLGGKLRLLPSSPFKLLSSDVLNWKSKLALFLERFQSKKNSEADESIYAFAQRRVGTEIADKLVDPFVAGIYAGDAKHISFQSGFPRLASMEKDYGSITKGLAAARKARAIENPGGRASGRLWSFNSGLTELTDALAEKCGKQNISQFQANKITHNKSNHLWTIQSSDGESKDFDIAILTCPAFAQATMLKDLDSTLAETLDSIPYNNIAVIVMGFRSGDVPTSLEGFGYLTPSSENRSILGVQWCSSIFKGRAPEGAVLLRAMCGGASRPELLDLDDDTLARIVYRELQSSMKVQAPPFFVKVIRWKKAIPQYILNHQEKISKIDASLLKHPGLYLSGNAFRGVALNDCVENAEKLAVQVSRWWNRDRQNND